MASLYLMKLLERGPEPKVPKLLSCFVCEEYEGLIWIRFKSACGGRVIDSCIEESGSPPCRTKYLLSPTVLATQSLPLRKSIRRCNPNNTFQWHRSDQLLLRHRRIHTTKVHLQLPHQNLPTRNQTKHHFRTQRKSNVISREISYYFAEIIEE